MRCIYPSLLCTVPLNCIIDKYTSEVNNSSDTIHLPIFVHIYMQSGRLAGLGWCEPGAVYCLLVPRWRRREWHTASAGFRNRLLVLVLVLALVQMWKFARQQLTHGPGQRRAVLGTGRIPPLPSCWTRTWTQRHHGPGWGGDCVCCCCDNVTGSRLLQLRIK